MNVCFKYILKCDVMQTPLHIGTRSTVCIGGVVGHMTFKCIAAETSRRGFGGPLSFWIACTALAFAVQLESGLTLLKSTCQNLKSQILYSTTLIQVEIIPLLNSLNKFNI